MKLEQVSNSCYAILNEKNRVCDANSSLINLGGGVVIDTQSEIEQGRNLVRFWEPSRTAYRLLRRRRG